jgi:hypothetical protein
MGFVFDYALEYFRKISSSPDFRKLLIQYKVDPNKADVFGMIGNAVVVNIQNVCNYYFESPKDVWDLREDFPVVIPPFEHMWMEYKIPNFMNIEGKIVPCIPENHEVKIGLLFHTMKSNPPHKFAIGCHVSRLIDGKFEQDKLSFTYKVGQSGQMEKMKSNDGSEGFFLILGAAPPEGKIDSQELTDYVANALRPCLLAMSFMSCKNIKTAIQRESIPKLNARRAKEGKGPLHRVYTLVIDPMRKIINSSTSHGTLSAKALHICRGHFKDFSNGPGLFGKYTGRYWWPMTVKGSSSEGIVKKDYAVKSP